jgi:hypothetical protein
MDQRHFYFDCFTVFWRKPIVGKLYPIHSVFFCDNWLVVYPESPNMAEHGRHLYDAELFEDIHLQYVFVQPQHRIDDFPAGDDYSLCYNRNSRILHDLQRYSRFRNIVSIPNVENFSNYSYPKCIGILFHFVSLHPRNFTAFAIGQSM